MIVIGEITDSRGPLPGASVYVSDADGNVTIAARGTSADAEGYYQLNANPGEYITASFVGNRKLTKRLNGPDDGLLNFRLEADNNLPEAVVTASKSKKYIILIVAAALIILLITYYYLYKNGKI